jgi:hypothetical protein
MPQNSKQQNTTNQKKLRKPKEVYKFNKNKVHLKDRTHRHFSSSFPYYLHEDGSCIHPWFHCRVHSAPQMEWCPSLSLHQELESQNSKYLTTIKHKYMTYNNNNKKYNSDSVHEAAKL